MSGELAGWQCQAFDRRDPLLGALASLRHEPPQRQPAALASSAPLRPCRAASSMAGRQPRLEPCQLAQRRDLLECRESRRRPGLPGRSSRQHEPRSEKRQLVEGVRALPAESVGPPLRVARWSPRDQHRGCRPPPRQTSPAGRGRAAPPRAWRAGNRHAAIELLLKLSESSRQ